MTLFIGTLLIITRLAAMTLVAPILGSRPVPIYIRIAIALTIGLSISPIILDNPLATSNLGAWKASTLVSSLTSEAIVGIVIGFGVLIIFMTAQMIGSTLGQLSGLQLDALANNNDFGQQPTSQLIAITASVAFVLSGGLEALLSTVIESFLSFPPGNSPTNASAIQIVTTLLQQSFELTVRAVAPAIATLLISTVVVGLISRTLPQLNLLQVGLSSNFGLMMLALFFTLGGSVWLVIDNVEDAANFVIETLQSAPKR